jgi:hypothetical protein
MMYGKKSKVTPPMPKPRRGTMNEMMGGDAIMRPAPVTPPVRKPRRNPGHNTKLGKYAD